MGETLRVVNKIAFVLLFIVACITQAQSQSYPVQVNTALTPPYSAFLADYSAPESQRFTVTFLMKDLTVIDYKGKLRLTIEGVGITIRTKQNFVPVHPITLYGGEPLTLFGSDLEEYFNPNNLDFAGISRSQYEKGAKLPEGVYRFTVEMLDYNRSSLVSNKGTAVAWIILNDPPLLNLPRADTKVKIVDPTNIAFTWTPRHTGSPNSAFTTEYVFKLIEVWPATRNPYDALLSQQPLYEITTSETQIVYGPAEPALIPGRKYAWQVQAKDVDGKDLFKNQGKSEVYAFQFGDALAAPENFRKDGGYATLINLRWEPSQTGAAPQQYRVRYRPTNTDRPDIWYENVTNQLWITIPDLKADTEYDMQIRAEAKPQYSDYSALQSFRTEVKSPARYTCGKEGVYPPGDKSAMLMTLVPGNVITCRGFQLLVTEVAGSAGNFTGKGWVKMMWFNGAGILSTFSGQVNSNYELVTGGYESVYDDGNEAAQDISDAYKIGKQPKQQSPTKDTTTTIKVPDYTITGTIDSVYVNDGGKIVVIDTKGNESTYEQKKDEKTGKVKETVVADASGTAYTVGADGKVTKASGSASQPSGNNALAVNYAGSKEAKLIGEILKRFGKQIAAVITPIRQPIYPGNGAGPIEDMFAIASACMPDNQEQLKIIKVYADKVNENENLLNAFITQVFNNETDKAVIVALAKTDLKDNQKYEDVLSKEDLQKAEETLCPHITDAAKKEFIDSWWRSPYWVRAAKILKEQFEDQDLYDDVYLVYGENECKTVAVLKLSEEATITTEVTFGSNQTPAQLWEILHEKYGVDFLVARDVTLESFGEWFWNYMGSNDDKLYHGTSWESKSLKFFADMLMAAPGTLEGWVTGKHWRTGEELAMWEQILGILDVIPAEAFAKAGVTALVIKIGSKVIDISKLTQPVKNFITTAYKSGLKLLIKSTDEIIIYAGASKQQIGRFLNGVLQDLYWNYGGEKLIARLAGIKYMVDPDTKKIVEGTLDIVEGGGKVGIKKVISIINQITEKTKKHIFRGEINSSGQAVGCHSKGAIDNGYARYRPYTTITNGPNNTYKVGIDVKDANGKWIPKKAESTFFPDLWDEEKILTEIGNAYNNKTFINGNTWEGLSSEGVKIRMFLKTDGTNEIISAFPIF